MKIFITGICGFVGATLARSLKEASESVAITGLDNLSRPGSEINRRSLARLGVKVLHGDVRSGADLQTLPGADWVIDAAANPSVLAGVDGKTSSRQLVEHNLWGTVNVLEYCKAHRAGFILLSTSRVYAIRPLAELPVWVQDRQFQPRLDCDPPPGLSVEGVSEVFSTCPPVSLYGSTKLASEQLALEYGEAFGLPVWINRCGVMAGAGQFGRADQGIFAYWINAHLRKRPLKYLGFGGQGYQVRDCLHPRDLVPLLLRQISAEGAGRQRVQNVGGGRQSGVSLCHITEWCDARFGKHAILSQDALRPFDIPWMVLDPSLACHQWDWQPTTALETILDEIARHAETHPDWLELSADP